MANKHQVKYFSLLTLIIYCFCSCHQTNESNGNVERMADLECRAIALREQRFALADSIRFTQDTLLHTKTEDSVRLNNKLNIFLKQKETLLQRSLVLADSIHNKFDSLRKYVFIGLDDKKVFEQKLKETMDKRECK